MRVSAKVDYALRAMAELAAAPPGLTTAEQLAAAQHIPPKFLESILSQLRSAGLVASQRGAEAGYQRARRAPGRALLRRRGGRAARRLARAPHPDPRRPRGDDARGHRRGAAQGLT